MKTVKCLAAILALLCLESGMANAQTNKTTNCWTESGQWFLDCTDEYLDGDMTFCLTRWLFKSQNHITLKQKANLTGADSGDTYTVSRMEKIRFKELEDGMVYVKSGIQTFSIYRNGEFWAVAHLNRHITFNAKGDLVVFVDHRLECD